MSRGNDRHEAQRWLDTARDDLGAASAMTEAGYHAHACFSSQQCAEKAAKAMWYLIGADPWGHSVQALVTEFPQIASLDDATALIEKAAVLDRFYIPTRYPSGLPDLTPGKTYFPADAQRAIELADYLLEGFRRWIDSYSPGTDVP
jgi:HEPN domain-containing protein